MIPATSRNAALEPRQASAPRKPPTPRCASAPRAALGAALSAVALWAAAVSPLGMAATVGQPAPEFTLTDLGGKSVSLAAFRGRTVVLEWNNPNCPFVQKHYRSGNMQSLQKRHTGEGVAWLAVNSTSPRSGDHMSAADLTAFVKANGAAPSAYLLDPDGKVGKAYGARVTPHMYVIDAGGKLVYNGAIDDKRSASPEDVKTAKNFVAAALSEVKAGKPVTVASNSPYGCTVKYD